MIAPAGRHGDALCVVRLDRPDDFDGFRRAARGLLAAEVPPECVTFSCEDGQGDLFAGAATPIPPAKARADVRIPREFLQLAQSAALHSDPRRFALLYRLVWRLRDDPRVAGDPCDPDMLRLQELVRQVRRDIHKMRAFVRFREIVNGDGTARFIAWFEPGHHILRANADFFVNRFAGMRWSILTPRGSLDWDGQTLRDGPPASRGDAPCEDAGEELWRRYYAAIFNPARLKVRAMIKEMPRRYWHNMPETALIPQLIAGAQAREAAMVAAGATRFEEPAPQNLDQLADALAACRRCSIGCLGTRPVAGEGPAAARIMLVGEQPGDMEEQQGRPFVGPAGAVLDAGLARAGLQRADMWVTNAVKHFKFARSGKRRLHQNPTASEIDTCRWWLEAEIEAVRPDLILALGASAARAVLGRTPSINSERGKPITLLGGAELWITAHPSYILRLEGAAADAERDRFVDDLKVFQRRSLQLCGAAG